MLKVVSYKICPFVQRVTALLEAKKISYEIEYINLRDKPQWFLDVSPTGQVPVLVTEEGTTLFESDAIVEYLDEIYPPLRDVTPEERAVDRAWSYQASKHYLVQCSTMQSPDEETLGQRGEKLSSAFGRAEKQLGDGPYFGGDMLGNVDIAWLPLLHRAEIVRRHSGYDFLAEFPKARAWQAALMKTGVPAKSVAGDFEDRFSEFYLSERTYLGRQGAERRSDTGDVHCCGPASCCD
ncbi:MAG: glutathione S-transferase family protein [Myxococcota bacterium]